ncbi:MAG: type I DNA topoisomerase [Lachnospiraceae bacterium]|nr:type I DNA topoisomerase [Lachnospiraceae bacterium]
MAKYLVIVESPAKVKTIKKFLGNNYQVVASNGHVRDLPKSTMGIDVENDYEPKYITIRGKGDVLSNLRKEVKKAEKVYLATDPDREGEAISWHLYYALKLNEKPTYRITFNEITGKAVKESLKHPREIDMDLVNAQQTRRILDRMVGYRISPVLWAKIKGKLSAGRVQSATLRMVCDREKEIDAFVPEEYWTLDASLEVDGQKRPITAKYYGNASGKQDLKNKKQVEDLVKSIQKKAFTVKEVKKGERTRKSPLPFTTSTMQQEASKTLNFATQKTMRLAQQLYEGVEISGEGTVGLISYLRTDSTRVSDEARTQAEKYIDANYGKEYLGSTETAGKTGQKIQDAHEAIRPTDVNRTPSSLKDQLPRDLYRLYTLIWKRFMASQMAEAKYETTSVRIQAGEEIFTLSAARVTFDGFRSVYTETEEEEESNSLQAAISEKSKLKLLTLDPKQHFTQPPAHYTEAALVHEMEAQGIGRPSTYAPTITNLVQRRYVIKEQKNLFVTELGNAVNDMMNQAFPSIVDLRFTANMETLLDSVEEGTVKWKTVIANFYPDLDEAVKAAEKELEHVKIEDEVSEEICENCGVHMVVKYGPHGKFLACPNFPECRNTKTFYERIGVPCPKCGKDVVIRMSKKGRRYFGCMGFPDCDFMSWNRPVKERCPECGSYMVEKGNRMVCANKECGHIISNTTEKVD